jgi:hypothetical protein
LACDHSVTEQSAAKIMSCIRLANGG